MTMAGRWGGERFVRHGDEQSAWGLGESRLRAAGGAERASMLKISREERVGDKYHAPKKSAERWPDFHHCASGEDDGWEDKAEEEEGDKHTRAR
jgi:hypothetical protein